MKKEYAIKNEMRKTLDVSLKTVIFFFIDRYPRSVAKFPSECDGKSIYVYTYSTLVYISLPNQQTPP